MVAVVQAVDYPDRLVTLKNEEGKIVTIKAGEEVCNLVQIKPGAIVKATYSEALAVQLTKSRAEAMGVPPDHPEEPHQAAAALCALSAAPWRRPGPR